MFMKPETASWEGIVKWLSLKLLFAYMIDLKLAIFLSYTDILYQSTLHSI